MPSRFPARSFRKLPGEPRALALELDRLASNGELGSGFLHYVGNSGERYLFVLGGKAHAGGSFAAGLTVGLPMKRFFAGLKDTAEVELAECDDVLLGALTVLFAGDATARVPSFWLGASRLLELAKQRGKDATLVCRSRGRFAIVPMPAGAPAAFFGDEDGPPASGGSVAERIADWAAANPSGALELHDGLRAAADEDAGQPFLSYTDAEPAVPDALVIRLGGKVVYRYELAARQITIGRGPENDLPLDNLSVSRQHAAVVRHGSTLLVQDLGSENGLVFRGRKVTKAVLAPGDELEIGRYVIAFSRGPATLDELAAAAPRPAPAAAAMQATFVVDSKPLPEIEHRGRRIKLGGILFTIGSAPTANLRVERFLVAGVHARIGRDDAGATLTPVGAWRKVTVNGVPVRGETKLADGDEIAVAGETITFHAPKAPAPAPPAGLAQLGPRR